MKLFIANDYNEMSLAAAEIFKEAALRNPRSVFGLATGSSPIGLYNCLVAFQQRGEADFRGITTFNLDEYIGLDPAHDQSYRYFMETNLFDRIGLPKENVRFPHGSVEDLAAECLRYTTEIAQNPPHIQLLGIGVNGHIGFNEPGTPFDSHTHIVRLKEDTILQNSRFFASMEDVPKTAITMGIQDILSAKMIVLVASGSNKADALYRMLKEKPVTDCPASALQLHKNVLVFADKAAASKL